MTDHSLQEIPNSISDAGAIRRLVENLYQGWGYNAYRKENQLRADDLLIRGKISDLLAELRRRWHEREMSWRDEHLPPPSRQFPVPDATAVQAAKSMESIQKQVEAFESLVRTAPVPENDRVWQRHRNETDTLAKLLDCDNAMMETLVGMLEAAATSTVADFTLLPITNLWNNRRALLGL